MAFWILSAACGLLLTALAVVIWVRRPPAPLWPLLFLCQILAICWVAGDLWASHARSLPEKQVALTLLFSGTIWIPAAWWEATRRYVLWHGLGRPWLASRWTVAPAVFAGVAWLFMLTNAWHGQFIEPVVGGRNSYLWGVTLLAYVNWSVAGATFVLCGWASRRHASPDVRRKMGFLAAAIVAPLLANIAHIYAPGLPREDVAALGLGLASITVLYGIRRARLFSLLPVALHDILRRDPNGVLILDPGGRLLLWNPAAEKLLDGLLLEPDMPLWKALSPRLDAPGSDRSVEGPVTLTALLAEAEHEDRRHLFRYLGPGGERWLRVGVVPLRRRGRVAAACLRLEDATREEIEARRRKAEAEQAHREKRAESLALMAGGIAHEFHTLLLGVEGRVRLALEDIGRGLPVRRHLRRILKSTRLAAELSEQLQAYAGRGRVGRCAVDLSVLVGDFSDLLDDALPRGVELCTELAPALPPVQADPTQLRQVLMNLVRNAGEAIVEPRGMVTIRTGAGRLDAEFLLDEDLAQDLRPGEHVFVEVSDDGAGIEEGISPQVFDAFVSTKGEGRGLGLALVRSIAASHRGAVRAESRPKEGARFRLWLPAHDA